MSLYSYEEICEGCEYAVFHECCNSFCHCKDDATDQANCYNGKCLNKKEDIKK